MPFFDGFEVDRNKHNNPMESPHGSAASRLQDDAASGGEGGGERLEEQDSNTSGQSDDEYSTRIPCGRKPIDESLAKALWVTCPDIDEFIFPVRQGDLQEHMKRWGGVALACARFNPDSYGTTHTMIEKLKKTGGPPTILVEDQSRFSITVLPDTTRIDVKGSYVPASGDGASGVSPPIATLIRHWSGDFSDIRDIRIPFWRRAGSGQLL